MKINKIFILAGILISSMLSLNSCSSDDDYTPGPEVAADCADLSFGSDNVQNMEVDPDITSIDIQVYRANTQATGTYAIKVLTNQDSVFTVPESVSFAAGQEEAVITASFSKSELGKTYTLEVGFDDADINPYTDTNKTFAYTVTRVKWNIVGTGQWLDGFWYGFWDEVTIQQLDEDPSTYRINNPYVNELVQAMGDTPGTYTKYLTFKLASNGRVSWDKFFYINTMYDESTEIKGYYPSSLAASQAAYDALSYAEKDENGNILFFQIAPYWYVDGVGGWGTDYPCYLAFPGVDLATEWEW